MSKIVVEDRTQPPSIEKAIRILADSIFQSIAIMGAKMRLNILEVALALAIASEDMLNYIDEIDRATPEDIAKLREDAFKNASDRKKELEDSGVIKIIKDITKKFKEKK